MSTIIDRNNETNDQYCVKVATSFPGHLHIGRLPYIKKVRSTGDEVGKVAFVGIRKWLILGVKGERQLLN